MAHPIFSSAQSTASVAASSSAQIGKQSSECVMLRCQVMTSNSLCESMSRKVSISGKIAPSIADQATIRPRFIGRVVNKSSPLNSALPINAPAIPCVMVSMDFGVIDLFVRVYFIGESFYKDERRALREDAADLAGFDAVTR